MYLYSSIHVLTGGHQMVYIKYGSRQNFEQTTYTTHLSYFPKSDHSAKWSYTLVSFTPHRLTLLSFSWIRLDIFLNSQLSKWYDIQDNLILQNNTGPNIINNADNVLMLPHANCAKLGLSMRRICSLFSVRKIWPHILLTVFKLILL